MRYMYINGKFYCSKFNNFTIEMCQNDASLKPSVNKVK